MAHTFVIIGNLFAKAACSELKWSLLVSSASSRSKHLTQFSAMQNELIPDPNMLA